mgnify:CR=1 FL=1
MATDQWKTQGPTSAPPAELAPEEEPIVTGTLFFMLLLLMVIFGLWGIMYATLLNR